MLDVARLHLWRADSLVDVLHQVGRQSFKRTSELQEEQQPDRHGDFSPSRRTMSRLDRHTRYRAFIGRQRKGCAEGSRNPLDGESTKPAETSGHDVCSKSGESMDTDVDNPRLRQDVDRHRISSTTHTNVIGEATHS